MKSEQPLASPGRGVPKRTTLGPSSGPSRRRGVSTPTAPPSKAAAFTKLVATKIIVPRGPSSDPRVVERERLVHALLAAQGRPAVTQATDALLRAGHDLPEDQEVHLQVLEHDDEARVRVSLAALATILGREPARRRPVLEQRLRRLEELAEDAATREAATQLRRKL
jgi:hypothetical protein